MGAPKTKPSPALPALTGVRFFAALWVVVYHYGMESVGAVAPWLLPTVAAGPAAVSFFYVLSGAVITWGCTGPGGQPTRPPRVFWAQRAARILPAYLLALLLSLPPFLAHAWLVHPGSGALLRAAAGVSASLCLVQAFLPPLAAGLNTPGWSISCEAFFYALWPGLVGRLRLDRLDRLEKGASGLPWRRVVVLWLVALAAPVLGLAALRAGLVPAGPYSTLTEDASGSELFARALSYLPLLRLPEFAIGITLGHALRATPPRNRSPSADTARELGLLVLLLAATSALGGGLAGRLSGVALADRIAIEGGGLAPLFALLVWQLARGRGLLGQLLSAGPLLALGEACYALYILQEPALVWTTAALKRLAPRLLAAHWGSLFWVYALLLVLGSLAVHRLVELPLRARIMARLSPRRPAS